MTVLVVDDEAPIRIMLKALLKTVGYSVLEAARAGDALAIAERNAFDLLISDVFLPDMPGPELAAAIQDCRPGVHVLLTSGCPEVPVDGDWQFIQKPFNVADLLTAIQRRSRAVARAANS